MILSRNQDKWARPRAVDSLTVLFPAHVIAILLPTEDEIPKDLWRGTNQWNELASELSREGGTLPPLKPRIRLRDAMRHIQAVLWSFEPSHQHKIAGVGWLLSLWCEELP